MILKNEYIVAGIIIALLIGSGAGYIYGQSPIAGYKEEVDRLEAENINIQDQLTEVREDFSLTRSSLEDLQFSYSSLQLSYGAIKEDYDKLRECVPSGVEILYSEMKRLLKVTLNMMRIWINLCFFSPQLSLRIKTSTADTWNPSTHTSSGNYT
jgi:hypothetical protein